MEVDSVATGAAPAAQSNGTNGHAPPDAADYQPKETLYIRNIQEKLKKKRLRVALHTLFSEHGRVMNVTALRAEALRGQAWVTFEDLESAVNARNATNGRDFFGSKLDVQFAKERSDVLSKKLDSSFIPDREKRSRKGVELEERKRAKKQSQVMDAKIQELMATPATKLILAKGLPEQVGADELKALFEKHAGLVDVRRVPRRGIAFVEFDSEANARAAILALAMHKVTEEYRLDLSFASEAE